LILLVMLVPAAHFAWRNRDMPQFAYLHDDGVLFVSAKSLAQHEFRIPSMLENPSQTKFPVLYPLYLSAIWRLDSHFPDNLELAIWFCWITLALCLVLARLLYQSDGYKETRIWLLTGLLAMNPYFILFGCSMFSEMFFTVFLIATFLAARKAGSSPRAVAWMIAAGVAAGCAYLSRTAAIPLIVAVPVWLALKRRWRDAWIFAAAMAPFVIGWTLWARAHMLHSNDPTMLYYTDYLKFWLQNITVGNPFVKVWKNIDQLLYGMGSLVLPKVVDMGPVKTLAQVIGVAMIVGLVRLVRRGVAVDYALFALLSVGILVIWHYPPNERFVLPLFPLLLAGLIEELDHIVRMLRGAFRHKDAGQRVAGRILAGGVVIVFGAALALQFYVTFVFLEESAVQKRAKLADLRTSYTWITKNVPADAGILSYDDPLMYLFTGRQGHYMPLQPRWWYTEDHQSNQAAYRDVAKYCREHGLTYLFFTTGDLEREVGDEDKLAIQQSVATNPELERVFQAGIGTVYRVLAATTGSAATVPAVKAP
jgi:hypothetical protein